MEKLIQYVSMVEISPDTRTFADKQMMQVFLPTRKETLASLYNIKETCEKSHYGKAASKALVGFIMMVKKHAIFRP